MAVEALTEQQAVCNQEKEDAGNDIWKTSFPECELLVTMATTAGALNDKCMALPMACNGCDNPEPMTVTHTLTLTLTLTVTLTLTLTLR